jgi:hypothetical protein
MAKEPKIKPIKPLVLDINLESHGTFSALFRRFGFGSEELSVDMLRQLLSHERARMIHVIRTQKPGSIYFLAKALGRDFKAVKKDILLLKKFNVVDLEEAKYKGRKKLKPVLKITGLQVNLNF